MSSGGVNVKAVVTNSANGEPAVGASLQVEAGRVKLEAESINTGDKQTTSLSGEINNVNIKGTNTTGEDGSESNSGEIAVNNNKTPVVRGINAGREDNFILLNNGNIELSTESSVNIFGGFRGPPSSQSSSDIDLSGSKFLLSTGIGVSANTLFESSGVSTEKSLFFVQGGGSASGAVETSTGKLEQNLFSASTKAGVGLITMDDGNGNTQTGTCQINFVN